MVEADAPELMLLGLRGARVRGHAADTMTFFAAEYENWQWTKSDFNDLKIVSQSIPHVSDRIV